MHTFSSEQYLALDNWWKLLDAMETFPDLLATIHDDPESPTWNIRDPLQQV